MKIGYYILENKVPVHTEDIHVWGEWIESFKNKVVDKTVIGDVQISTVFLGLDHNFLNDGPPILFETMIFGGVHDEYQERYATWDEAVAGHKFACEMVSTKD